MATEDFAPVPPASAALSGRCPHCGQGHLFKGFLEVAPRCEVCGLDFAFADSGDGPAVFVSFAALVVVTGAALLLDAMFDLPIWLIMLIIVPLSAVLCLGLLRPAKGLMIGLQYKHKAEQGRFLP